MKPITEYLTTKVSKSTIKATNDTIKHIVKEEMNKYGHDCDLNHVDVSEVTDMNYLFSCDKIDLGKSYLDLNPDISEWNVSNVTIMTGMFCWCENFNCDISSWNVSNVTHMDSMFYKCEKFNQDINRWDVSALRYANYMFSNCTIFNQELNMWDVSNVIFMTEMFYGCKNFNKDLSKWNVKNTKYRNKMFYYCPIEEKYKPHFSI